MSETSTGRAPLPLILIIKFVLNVAMAWFLATQLDQYFQLTGGLGAYVVVGALLTLMNMIVRPLLHIITLPLKLFATLAAVIIVQAGFVQLTVMIVRKMDPAVLTLEIFGGLWGWIVVAVILGFGNWLIKVALK
jgi:uncharacterized membrane protein YvlD (DUF360 family)